MECTIYVMKTETLICAFDFIYAKDRFFITQLNYDVKPKPIIASNVEGFVQPIITLHLVYRSSYN